MRMNADNVESRFRDALERQPGLTLRLDIINKCNLRCVMCYFSDETVFKRKTRKMTPQEFRELYDGVAPYVGRVVLSCGDEPLVSNHFAEILGYLGDGFPQLEIEFCTNAMLMNARVRSLMIEKGVTHLMLSMDGTTRHTLERIRVGAKYDKVVANIAALRDLKQATSSRFPALVMDYVMMSSNVHEAPAFVELCKRLGIELIDFRHVIPSVYFDEPDEQLANHPAKYNYFRERVLQEARRHRIDVVM
ncbi:MAG: radical SAM protein, partial [Acidobacteriota bacterium]